MGKPCHKFLKTVYVNAYTYSTQQLLHTHTYGMESDLRLHKRRKVFVGKMCPLASRFTSLGSMQHHLLAMDMNVRQTSSAWSIEKCHLSWKFPSITHSKHFIANFSPLQKKHRDPLTIHETRM